MQTKISVCIPVFGTESFLAECLESVASQDFTSAEIIIVNDGSKGKDSAGNNCKKIVKAFKKHSPFKITYIEHSENLGLLEARRTAVYTAKGKYIAMVDSDDHLLPEALKSLYDTAEQNEADIVHGTSTSNAQKQRNNAIYIGTLSEKEILYQWLVKSSYNDALWGKLIDKDLYLEALDKIPRMYCNMAEDIVQWFFIAVNAKKYIGIDVPVYFYNANTGMTSQKLLTEESELQGIVTPASVFTVIHQWLQGEADKTGKLPITSQELSSLRSMSHQYLENNLLMIRSKVATDLQPAAKELLCEYWGKDFVELMLEKQSEKSEKNHQK